MKNRALFLISIPKSGTHLIYKLAEALGYKPGVVCPDYPLGGYWYCLEYSNSHTTAKDFFIDTVRRSPFGNRDHPFPRTPAIFIYRNPLDIVTSEANYYHLEGKTVFSSYLRRLPFEKRLLKLIDDPFLLGSIRDRINNFTAWLEFENVIPVSFEELVGDQGGGSTEEQLKTIASIQEKLNVPGKPEAVARKIFDPNSPTFFGGNIGGHKKYFTEKAYEKFFSLPQDFMEALGYDADTVMPKRIGEFRQRPLKLSDIYYDRQKHPQAFFLRRYIYRPYMLFEKLKVFLWKQKLNALKPDK